MEAEETEKERERAERATAALLHAWEYGDPACTGQNSSETSTARRADPKASQQDLSVFSYDLRIRDLIIKNIPIYGPIDLFRSRK